EEARGLVVSQLEADFRPVYRTRRLRPDPPPAADIVLLASASAAGAFADLQLDLPVITIGPQTTRAAHAQGLRVLAQARTADVEGRIHVGPGNGLLLPAVAKLGGIAEAHELTNPEYALESVSRTFHGRDLFSPAAAHLAIGVPLAELGPPIAPDALARLDIPT